MWTKSFFHEDLGWIELVADAHALRELKFVLKPKTQKKSKKPDADLRARRLLIQAEKELKAYLSGKLKTFSVPLHFEGTEFQKKVWQALQEIPYSQTWSYEDIAKKVARPRAVRAVGSANGKNPLPIFCPCHRVIQKSGQLGGYSSGLDKKIFLLRLESARSALTTNQIK